MDTQKERINPKEKNKLERIDPKLLPKHINWLKNELGTPLEPGYIQALCYAHYAEAKDALKKSIDENDALKAAGGDGRVSELSERRNITLPSARKTLEENLPKIEKAIKLIKGAIKDLEQQKETQDKITALQQELEKMESTYKTYENRLRKIVEWQKNIGKALLELLQSHQTKVIEQYKPIGKLLSPHGFPALFQIKSLDFSSLSLQELVQLQESIKPIKETIGKITAKKGSLQQTKTREEFDASNFPYSAEIQSVCNWGGNGC